MRYLLVIAVLCLGACLDTGQVSRKIKKDLNDLKDPFQPHPQKMSCLLAQLGECVEFVDKRWTQADAQKSCEATSRARLAPMFFHSRQGCGSSNEVYRCNRQLKKSRGLWVRNVLYAPQYDKNRAKRVCR